MKNIFIILSVLFSSVTCHAQFAPQAGLAGNTAIYKDSSIIVEWASQCSIYRGWQDIADTTLGKALTGDSSKALGTADADVVSLGDGGEAVLYFENPIINGNGFDFAVFENGFRNPSDSNEAFLELATVEVSNNGISYFPFAAQSHHDTLVQVAGAGVYMDARKVNNLAGKYVSYYGTPFDLDELSMILSLDVNNIHFVRIKDVVGSINKAFCSRDMNNHIINDPYPTPFPTGGFDLDAIGVIHHKFPTGFSNVITGNEIFFYPNPATDMIYFKDLSQLKNYRLFTADGKILMQDLIAKDLSIAALERGLYFLQVEDHQGVKKVYRLLKS